MTFLKDCPNCGMTVSAHCECPICKADITDEPYSKHNGERYKLSKLFWPYFFRKCWLFLICFTLIILKTIFFGVTVMLNVGTTVICVFSTFICLIFSFFDSLFPEWLKSLSEWKYSDNYIDMTSSSAWKYILGILALLFTIIW